jgi:hypothetical protein
VLIDPKKREIYDELGNIGLELAESPLGVFVGPKFVTFLKLLAMSVLLITVLLITFFAFLARQIDNEIDRSWAEVFIPLWIADVFVCVALIHLVFSGRFPTIKRPQNEDEDEEDHRSRYTDTPTTPTADQPETGRRTGAEQQIKERWRYGIYIILFSVSTIIFQLFIVLKGDQVVEWSAAIVFLPYWVFEGLNLLSCLTDGIAQLKALSQQRAAIVETGGKKSPALVYRMLQASILRYAFWWYIVRVALAILVVLKLDGKLDVSWAVVFIPAYLAMLCIVISFILQYCFARQIQNSEAKTEALELTVSSAVGIMIGCILFYAFIGLLVEKLESPESHSMAVVFIPIFILLAMFACCSCCSLSFLCLIRGIPDDVIDEETLQAIEAIYQYRPRITEHGEQERE